MAPGKKSAKKAAKAAAKAAGNVKKAVKAVAKVVPGKAAKPDKADKDAKPSKPDKTAKAGKAAAVPKVGKAKKAARRGEPDVDYANPILFEPLSEGEVADALRVMSEDRRLAAMAKVGRYRVAAVEPLVVKPPHPRAGFRLARVVVYDYASDSAVDVCVDLDHSDVATLSISKAQPMLARDEEATAISVAIGDERVAAALSLGDEALVAMHYWSDNPTDLSHTRRSAAVLFGRSNGRPSVVAVVDLLDRLVTDVVPAEQW